MTLTDDALAAAVEQAMQDHYLPPLDGETPLEDCEGRYILLERGHYGTTWVSGHNTPADAARYSLHQEYAEDWSATVLIDRETGQRLEPDSIVWMPV